jgi:hypothetical protein
VPPRGSDERPLHRIGLRFAGPELDVIDGVHMGVLMRDEWGARLGYLRAAADFCDTVLKILKFGYVLSLVVGFCALREFTAPAPIPFPQPKPGTGRAIASSRPIPEGDVGSARGHHKSRNDVRTVTGRRPGATSSITNPQHCRIASR